MSVTISRFVRIMTDGKVVTNKLVAKLDAKLTARIESLQELIKELDTQGVSAHQLKDHHATLKQLQANARKNPDNAAKSELLESGKAAAGRAIAAGPWLVAVAKVDAALAKLAKTNARIPDAPLKKIAAAKLADLTERRAVLVSATDNRLELAQTFLEQVVSEATWSDSAIIFGTGTTKSRRDMARNGAAHYLREGTKLARSESPERKEQGKQLIDIAKKVQAQLNEMEEVAKINPQKATDLFPRLDTKYYEAKALYETAVLAPGLTEKVKKLAAANPNGPEARMQDALSPQVFQKRMLAAYNIALTNGFPEIDLLTPGEAVAIFSYTTGDYKDMNKVLLNGIIEGGDDAKRKVQIKIDEAMKAMAKLKPHPVTSTTRGEHAWPGDSEQYTVGNVFALKIFWSTGVDYSFAGDWQITVSAKSGKNVATLSDTPWENEILFPPGTKLKVKSVNRTETGGRVVVEEV